MTACEAENTQPETNPGPSGWIVVIADVFDRFLVRVGTGPGLVALGLAVAGFSFGARLDDPRIWGHDELFASLGFASLLTLLGVLERLIHPAPAADKRSLPPTR